MTIITAVPPPEAPGMAGQIPIGAGGAIPGPLRFIGRALRTLWSNGKARTGLIILGLFICVAVFAPLLAPHSPTATTFTPFRGPNAANWFGTTGNGQDVFSQMIYGARVSLIVGLVAGGLATLVAVTLGLIAGYRPGPIDEVLGFVTNLALVIPALPLMIILAAYLQGRSIWTIVLVVAFTSWATGARVIRSQASTLRTREFVTSAVFSGERLFRVVFREILPNMTSLVAASFFAAATAAVLAEASLEFLGLGNPATVSWGTILFAAQRQNALLTGQWVMVFAPGLAIVLLMVSFTLINFGVDALSNPRLREKLCTSWRHVASTSFTCQAAVSGSGRSATWISRWSRVSSSGSSASPVAERRPSATRSRGCCGRRPAWRAVSSGLTASTSAACTARSCAGSGVTDSRSCCRAA
jgi:peptide/nickel transport system permease protein